MVVSGVLLLRNGEYGIIIKNTLELDYSVNTIKLFKLYGLRFHKDIVSREINFPCQNFHQK